MPGKDRPSRERWVHGVDGVMRMISKPMVVHFSTVVDRFSRITRHAKIVAAFLCIAQLHHPAEALSQTTPGSYNVTLAWNGSTSTGVTGYRIHYGSASGTYTGSIAVGNETTTTVPGLASGVTYYFAVTALNADGLESDFSNEASFLPGLQGTRISTSPTGELVLTVKGLIGQQYDIEASEDLKNWTIISTVTLGDGGTLEFTDPNAAAYPKRFYRTRESQ